MKTFKNDFDKVYEELSTLNEDKENVRSFNFDGDLKDLATSADKLTNDDGEAIRVISSHLVGKFKNTKPNGKPVDWGYQFQLMYNAYQTECKTLELLNDTKFVETINKTFIEETLRNRLNAVSTHTDFDLDKAFKATENIRSNISLFEGQYNFNSKNHDHNVFALNTEGNPFRGEDVVDIETPSDKAICKYIEVKGTTGEKYPSGLHKAGAAFVYQLDIDRVDVGVKLSLINPIINDMLEIVDTSENVVKEELTEAKAEFADEYILIGSYENAGVQDKCITVRTPKVPTITKFTPRASK